MWKPWRSSGGPEPRGWGRRLARGALRAGAAALLASAGLVLALRWVPPPTTAFMVQRRVQAWSEGNRGFRLEHRWVDWRSIAPTAPLAAVASEDQRFPHHWGFDLGAVEQALREHGRGKRLRGASTISQQTAKNLFLWPGRSLVRKGLEVYWTGLLELLWPKRRILEVYLNVARFGDGVFGVEAASRAFFGKPAARLTLEEASVLAAVLPNPVRLRADRPSAYVLERAAWIREQAAQLGGSSYLGRL